jgi:hypothetical protein
MESKIQLLEFPNLHTMREALESKATNYEGSVKDRVGYNFPLDGKYIVAWVKGDILTKKHEMLHFKYHTSEKYRQEVSKLWLGFSQAEQTKIIEVLSRLGYSKEVHLDEFQAYWFSERKPERFFGLKIYKFE